MRELNFKCQESPWAELSDCAKHNRHSILLEGPQGVGKTYLAIKFAKNCLNISDYMLVEPKVDEVRNAVQTGINLQVPIVIVIENLDLGVKGAAYALLKFLEEPKDNVYIIVTCRNIRYVPDTIISRSFCITCPPPINSDIEMYSKEYNPEQYDYLKHQFIWKCATSLCDAKRILDLTYDQLQYFLNLKSLFKFEGTVYDMSWKLTRYHDNTPTPVDLVINYIVNICGDSHVKRAGLQCLKDLSLKRLSESAVISKFLFECKYCE